MSSRSLAAIAALCCASCTSWGFVDVNVTRAGAPARDYESALLASGSADLDCDSVRHGRVPIHDSRGTASVDVVDGCNRRALYGKKCDRQWTSETMTTTCSPSLLGRVELGAEANASE